MKLPNFLSGMTPARKALLAGIGVLAIGGVAGYEVGKSANRDGFGRDRGSMMRDDGERGWNRHDDAGRDRGADRQGRGSQADVNMERGDSNGQGKNQGGGQERGQGAGMTGGQGFGQMNRTFGKDGCVEDECLSVDGLEYPVGTLSDAAKSAVFLALDDEYKARATYEAVIAKLGSIRPFSMIIRSEEQHISSLKALLDKYGVAIPSDPWTGNVSAPDTLSAACQVGVDAETANASLYRDKFLPAVTDYKDITEVFTGLMDASQNRHLPAFEKCK